MPTFCRVTVNRYDGFFLNSNLAFPQPTGLLDNGYKPNFLSGIKNKSTHGKYPDEYFLNLYGFGEISAECLHFAGPLSIAITDFVRAPYALYSEQPFCFRSV